jgi:predicted nucleotide-binding protein with TIR-like domain/histidine-specific SAM-dependent methyltransferase
MSEKVFVVHGRNKGIRDAMFTFLRSLNLDPLEWEQARQLTGSASPTTLEIVQKGIEESTCVVVLFTGDDLAQLDPVYEAEEVQPQPRQNVVFEAGWALATGGQQNTILIRVGQLRQFSDIEGLNFVELNNFPETRKALVGRLRDAGCQPDSSGADYLDPGAGGNFEPATPPRTDSVEYEDLLDRGRFTQFVADSNLTFGMSNIELNRHLNSDLAQASRLDLKYHYLGAECASYWLALSKHPDYGHRRLGEIIDDSSREILKALSDTARMGDEPIDLISLGPGDGEIDARLLHRLEQNDIQLDYYYCIDISFDLLQQAVAEVVRSTFLERRFRIKAIHGDFTQLERLKAIYTYDPSVNLFSMLGFTIGNYNEGNLLDALHRAMGSGDFLLMDARCHGQESWDGHTPLSAEEMSSLTRSYRHPINDRFAFGPVESATGLRSDQAVFDYEVGTKRLTVVPRALNIVTYCTNLEAEMRSNGKQVRAERLDLASTTLYSFNDLRDWLATRGFQVTWSKNVRDIGLFLLRKIG